MKGHLRKRGDRSWAVVLELGRGADGKRRQKWHTVHGTRKHAERELTRLVNDLNTGGYVEPSTMLVRDYLELWLGRVEPQVAAKTFERYGDIVRGHLVPSLGQHLLSKLQPVHIQQSYADALRDGRKNGKGGLSTQTVLHHHRVLRKALHQAVRLQLLARNPADAVDPPRPARREMMALDEAQTGALLQLAEGTPLHLPVLLAVTTGMRRGEVLALRWEDMDLERGVARVRRSLQQTRDGLSFKEPKTAKSRRQVDLPSIAVDALRARRVEQAKHRLRLGPAYDDGGLICSLADGAPVRPNSVTSTFKALARRAGVPALRFHDLRHGHATHLLRHSVHPKIVSERLGHSTIGITLDTYSHMLPGTQREAAHLLDTALRAAIPSLEAQS